MAKDRTFIVFLFFSLLLLLLDSSQQVEFTYAGFNGGAGKNDINVSMNGIARIEASGILRLTNETSRLIGRAFYPTPLQFKNATTGSAFAFAIVPEYPKLGGHGLAFVVAPSKDLKGALPSQYLGLLNDNDKFTNHVFAVEFDTVQDFEFHDINDMASNASASAADINIKSGDTIQAWVDYDGVKKVVNVWISTSSSRPDTPLISFPVYVSFSSVQPVWSKVSIW